MDVPQALEQISCSARGCRSFHPCPLPPGSAGERSWRFDPQVTYVSLLSPLSLSSPSHSAPGCVHSGYPCLCFHSSTHTTSLRRALFQDAFNLHCILGVAVWSRLQMGWWMSSEKNPSPVKSSAQRDALHWASDWWTHPAVGQRSEAPNEDEEAQQPFLKLRVEESLSMSLKEGAISYRPFFCK